MRSTHPISFVCCVSFSGRRIFSPYQLRNRSETAGGKDEVGDVDLIKGVVSYITHEAVSSSLDPPLTLHVMECLVSEQSCVCVCVCMYNNS